MIGVFTENGDDVTAMLDDIVGKRVTVNVSSIPFKRDDFHTQISVAGKLEKHPSGEYYRVVVGADDSNYTYFTPEDVSGILNRDNYDGSTFKDGSVAAIYLDIKPVDEEWV
jgi:hypothetical protein